MYFIVLPIRHGGYSIAMLVYQRVSPKFQQCNIFLGDIFGIPFGDYMSSGEKSNIKLLFPWSRGFFKFLGPLEWPENWLVLRSSRPSLDVSHLGPSTAASAGRLQLRRSGFFFVLRDVGRCFALRRWVRYSR